MSLPRTGRSLWRGQLSWPSRSPTPTPGSGVRRTNKLVILNKCCLKIESCLWCPFFDSCGPLLFYFLLHHLCWTIVPIFTVSALSKQTKPVNRWVTKALLKASSHGSSYCSNLSYLFPPVLRRQNRKDELSCKGFSHWRLQSLLQSPVDKRGLFLAFFQMNGYWNRTKGARCLKKSVDPYYCKWRKMLNWVQAFLSKMWCAILYLGGLNGHL